MVILVGQGPFRITFTSTVRENFGKAYSIRKGSCFVIIRYLFFQKQSERLSVLHGYHEKIVVLRKQLGLPSESTRQEDLESDLSTVKLEKYAREVDALSMEKQRRSEKIDALRRDIMELWSELCVPIQIPPQDSSYASADQHALERGILYHQPSSGANLLSLSHDTILLLEKKREELLEEKHAREEQVRKYAVRITALWDRLKISQEERTKFFSNNTGLGPAVLQAVCSFFIYSLR